MKGCKRPTGGSTASGHANKDLPRVYWSIMTSTQYVRKATDSERRCLRDSCSISPSGPRGGSLRKVAVVRTVRGLHFRRHSNPFHSQDACGAISDSRKLLVFPPVHRWGLGVTTQR